MAEGCGQVSREIRTFAPRNEIPGCLVERVDEERIQPSRSAGFHAG